MNILVTGGSGFIGRNVLESYLAQKHNIIAPEHKDLELLDEESVRIFFLGNRIDIVIHGAVKPGHRNAADPIRLLDANTRMFFNIVRNSDRFKKMIFLSSGAVYDMRHYLPKMKEDYFDTHVPVDEHGFSKYIIAKYIRQMDNIVELRLFGVFGKYEDYAIRFISNAICKALFDLPITIKQNRFFDYLFIEDLIPVVDYFLHNSGKYKAYNVTPDHSASLHNIADKVQAISGKELPIIVREEGLGSEYSGDNGRLHEDIQGIGFTPIDKAIELLYNWYVCNRGLIDKEKLLIDK